MDLITLYQVANISTSDQVGITNIDWNEIIYILVGAVIGFLASVIMLVVERLFDKKGKIHIYYKRSNQRGLNGKGWGFDDSTDGRKDFVLPIRFELQNTSNTTRVIRDISILLYSGNEQIGKMIQLENIHVKTRTGSKVTGEKDYLFGDDKGSYSFVLPPRSIQRQECEFLFVINENEIETKSFDKVIARYFDERNKAHTFKIMDVSKCWESKQYDIDDEWILLDDKVRIKL